jgi:hypothetical protein
MPFAKTPVRLALAPAVIVVGFVAKLVMVGDATTVTNAVLVTAVPAELVTVRV